MDDRIPASSRVSPVQFSTSIGISNGLDFGSGNLFPSLASIDEGTVGIDPIPSNAGPSAERSRIRDSDDRPIEILIEITKSILNEQQCPMLGKDIVAEIQRKGYTNLSNVLLENLEEILRKEVGQPESDIRQYQQHWFMLKSIRQLPSHQRTGSSEVNNMKYKKKYQRLKKIVKRLVFENVAIADEIVRTDAKFQRAKVQRKFLLKQLLEYQAMCAREPVQPVKVVVPPTEPVVIPPPISPPANPEPPAKPKSQKVRAKKMCTGKVKKEVESPSSADPVKPSADEINDCEVPSVVFPDNKGEAAVKPKRKKPGTAIKRRVQPIPVDSKGKPMFPIVLGGLTVHSLGDIVWDRPGFHSERYIWPVGFCSSRFYPSMKTPDKKCIYTCKILDGGYGPTFVMSPEDDTENSIEASSATACHCVVLKAINKARGKEATNTGSGPEFFGFSHPTIQYLLQSLPNARKCSKYQWVKFELPKGKATGDLSRKLGSSVLASDESMEVTESQDESLSNFDASQLFTSEETSETIPNLNLPDAPSNISEVSSPGFEKGDLSYQLKPTSGDPSLDLGTPISPPQSSLSSPLDLSPKINANSMSPSATSQPSFIIPPSSPLFGFDDSGLPDYPVTEKSPPNKYK